MTDAGAGLPIGCPLAHTRPVSYTLPVITLPIWIGDWEYECCGQPRRLGETVELELTFTGDIRPASEPDRVDVLGEGRVSIVGLVVGPVADEGNHIAGTLIASGAVRFAIEGNAPASRVMCAGHLWEIRHGWPTGSTTGELVGIRWRPAIIRQTSPASGVVEGYGPGDELISTEDWRARHEPSLSNGWALELAVNVSEDVAHGSHDQALRWHRRA